KVVDPAVADDFVLLNQIPQKDGFGQTDFEIPAQTLDNKLWIVAYIPDAGPVRYYLYDREKKQAKFLFTNRKALEGLQLAAMRPLVIKSRDGLDLVSYLTLPAGATVRDGVPEHPLPMVLFVHGGPWARDEWGYNPIHQW